MIHLHNNQIDQFNTFEVKTCAPELLLISSEIEFVDYISNLKSSERKKINISGELSNTILGDTIEYPVILFRDGDHIDFVQKTNSTEVHVSGSFNLDRFIDYLCAHDISGLELLSGIPGTVGGGISQNAAAYGQQISDNLVLLKVLNLQTNSIETLTPRSLRFSYRDSILKNCPGYSPKTVILEATFEFKNKQIQPVTYKDLVDHHHKMGRDPNNLNDRRLSVLEVRTKKGMIVDGENWLPCAGSFYLSPTIDKDKAYHIIDLVRGSEFARGFFSWYKPDAHQTRLPAAIVLRAAGFLNGDKWGSIGLSPHHILALCSYGSDTTGSDVYNLSQIIKDKVKQLFNIDLKEEVRFLGNFDEMNQDNFLNNHDFIPGVEEPKWAKELGTPPR